MWTLDVGGKLGIFKRKGGGKERDTAKRPITCGLDLTAVVGVERDAGPMLAALDRPAFPLTLGRRWAFPTDPIAGAELDVRSVDEGVMLVASERPGIRYVPATAADSGPFCTVPAGRDWRSRRHGGADTYRIAA
jgi:hypothetical protein